jgi:fimbrial chaperone protein
MAGVEKSVTLVVSALLTRNGPAAVGALEIGPVRVCLVGADRTTTINVRNVDTESVTVQVRAVDWTQPQGEDVYAPSDALVAIPPMLHLAPGEAREVLILVRDGPEAAGEQAFQLILDKLPDSGGPGVRTVVRALVPVFVTPSDEARPHLRWSAVRSRGNLILTAFNDGDLFERLLDVRVSAEGHALGEAAVEGYVLSGASRTWTLPAAGAASSLAIAGEGEFGHVEVQVPILTCPA